MSLIIQPLAAAIAIGLGCIGSGLAMGPASGRAYEALGRNPSASSEIRAIFTLGLVFAETIVIYALVVALLLLFRS